MNPQVFEGIQAICNTHARHLSWAMQQLEQLKPFTPELLSGLEPVQLAIFDQFIIRFSKLQDAMGMKLLPAVLELSFDDSSPAFIDQLNKLEKLGALSSTTQWLKFREMRNQFSHDYPDDPQIQCALLIKAFAMAADLLAELRRVESYSSKYL
ncbi:MAG: hypothetical protein KJ556_16000 [Gammaproteobacteria bacterium]|nr:hypothetical protein [Gammaproteobacteria bacterium]MBU2058328.1 hypothetical protein [Gammaproteobacteria bacterium]MBU2176619.1 hypothetical protein [Gammaproteobacteria bacterium]MBU2248439.1 hypothetical protein [Gammaproteobacteria bacterium]MBU2345698.1 hypothetical protein [Gammaproteobacteria bacterium]